MYDGKGRTEDGESLRRGTTKKSPQKKEVTK